MLAFPSIGTGVEITDAERRSTLAGVEADFACSTLEKVVAHVTIGLLQKLETFPNIVIRHVPVVGLLFRCFFVPSLHGQFVVERNLIDRP